MINEQNLKNINFIKLILLFIFAFEVSYASSKPINVTLVSSSNDNDSYWNMAHSFAKASAQDLNVNLEIKMPEKTLDRFDYLESLKEVFEREDKPDFVIAKFYEKITIDILSLSEVNNVPIFIVNSNISKNNKKSVGQLRRTFSTFMGHIAPNEQKVGYDLAKYLIKLKRQTNPNGRLKVGAIATSKTKINSKLRLKGLEKAVKEEYRTKLYKTVYTPSARQEAYIQANRLIKKYFDLNIVWAETDVMSLGINEAIVDNDLSEQTITGGVGFSKEIVTAIRNNKIKTAMGGSFTDAGFALVLIYDFLNGKDFFEQYNSKIDSNMFLITTDNVNKYLNMYESDFWQKIDFKKYSKIYNKDLPKYKFTLDNL